MPKGYEVTNIEFYSDDSNSSLTTPPTIDENVDINEGRISVSFLVECANNDSTSEQRTELWLFRYDDVQFRKFDLDENIMTNEVSIRATPLSDESNYMCFDISSDGLIDDDDDDGVTVPKSKFFDRHTFVRFSCSIPPPPFAYLSCILLPGRIITATQLNSQNHHHHPQLHACGSRGTGGVLTLGAPACLNIFDLEEDEEEE
jgi:hypothetical protein